MKYKNIVFDFGNVISKFNGHSILSHFCDREEDIQLLIPLLYSRWAEVDKGTLDYETYGRQALDEAPSHLKPAVASFLEKWPSCMDPIPQTHALIRELKERNVPIYLLSNAPVFFAEWVKDYEIMKYFDGIVFSGPLLMAKPEPEIYHYLFNTFGLKPEECFFLDDKEENILAGKALGMDGMIFTGDLDEVKRRIEF